MSEGTQEEQQPTVFILYIPGGAMLGLIPALTLARIESLTETPTPELFQVVEGVSTGSILAAGFNVPGMTAKREAELFAQLGPSFFPEIPGRWAKMHTRQGINTGKIYFGLDPEYYDEPILHDIDKLCKRMRSKADLSLPEMEDHLNRIEEAAKTEWFTTATQKQILKLGEQINKLDPGMEKYTTALAELVVTRSYSGRLSVVFKKAAQSAVDSFRDWYAPPEESLFDANRPQEIYQELYGDRKLSESVCSTYISAYDVVNNRIVTFSSLKDNLFDKNPDASATTQNDIKFWDAVMASTANELAFKSHITETNILCSDKAPFHKPRAVRDVLNNVPENTRVVLVIAGTGHFISQDLKNFLEDHSTDDEDADPDVIYRQKLEAYRERRAELGVSGNLILGQELRELESYTSSDAMDEFRETLGEGNVFDLSPRLSPYTPEESAKFPSRDVLDASRENIKKIIWRARHYCEEEDEQIRKISQMLVDNLYHIGKMEPEKYARVCKRIGLKTPNLEADVEKDTKGLENRIASNDNSSGLRRVWRDITKRFFGNGNSANVRHRRPPGPGGPRP